MQSFVAHVLYEKNVLSDIDSATINNRVSWSEDE